MGSVEVYILGQKYTIKGEEPDEHIIRLAEYVDQRLKEVFNKSPNIQPLKATIITALGIADELHKVKEEHELMAKEIEAKAEVLSTLLD